MGGLVLSPEPAECGATVGLLTEAEQALAVADPARASALMDSVSEIFECRPAVPVELARYWLVRGAIAAVGGAPGDALDAFSIAARISPGLWDEVLGPVLHEVWVAAADVEPGVGPLVVDGAPVDAAVRLDGQPVTLPATVDAGLHLVQVLDPGDRQKVLFSEVIRVSPDWVTTVAVPAVPEEAVAIEPSVARTGVYAAAGVGWSHGLRVRDGDRVEPAHRVVVPAELGVERAGATAFARGYLRVSPLLQGSLLWHGGGEVHAWPASCGVGFAGGAVLQRLAVGVDGAWTLPGRATIGLIGGVRLRGGETLELRPRLHVLEGRSPEPELTMMVRVAL